VECCVRDNDFSQKKVYRCELCERWFCERHIEPRLAFIRDLKRGDSPEVKALYHKEMQREDGHPDFEYSRRKFAELDIEEKRRSELMEEALNRMNARYGGRHAIPTFTPKLPKEDITKEDYPSKEHDFLAYDTPKTKPRRAIPIKKIVGASMVLVILGIFLWYGPTIVSMIQNLSSQNANDKDSSYTRLTLIKNASTFPNFTTLAFGDIDYSFSYVWQNNQYFLLVSNSILEGKSYSQPTNGSVYRDIGMEIKVSEVYSNRIVLLVKPTVQDYLASLSFKKMTIAQGQYQTVNFSGNEYTIGYFQSPPYYVNELTVSTPFFQSRQYSITSSQIVSCDLGLEIRVYKAATEYAIIFVKPSY